MPEIEIKRVRFFDGQFLKQEEFREEQEYHQHMRWRQNYVLYEHSGVIAVENPDDLQFFDLDNSAKTFRVKSGMAIARRTDTRDGKEVVLREDHHPINLIDQRITAGNTAFVTLHYAEVPAADPPSEGDVQEDTRVSVQAVVSVFSRPPPAIEPMTHEPYILLGTIDFDTMVPDYTSRNEARIRASLLGGSGPSPTRTITNISPSNLAPGTSDPDAQINGMGLAGATDVSFAVSGVTATVELGGTDRVVPISLAVDAEATVGDLGTFTVTTTSGPVSSGAVVFTVTPSVTPDIEVTGIDPLIANIPLSGTVGTLTVTGRNIIDASLDEGDPATGTSIRLVDPGNRENVLAPLTNPRVRDNDGTQSVIADLPLGGVFTQEMSPVSVEVEFGGDSRLAPNELVLMFVSV